MPLILDKETREKIVNKIKNLGYLYVTLDLAGYRTGSLNVSFTQNEEFKG